MATGELGPIEGATIIYCGTCASSLMVTDATTIEHNDDGTHTVTPPTKALIQ